MTRPSAVTTPPSSMPSRRSIVEPRTARRAHGTSRTSVAVAAHSQTFTGGPSWPADEPPEAGVVRHELVDQELVAIGVGVDGVHVGADPDPRGRQRPAG